MKSGKCRENLDRVDNSVIRKRDANFSNDSCIRFRTYCSVRCTEDISEKQTTFFYARSKCLPGIKINLTPYRSDDFTREYKNMVRDKTQGAFHLSGQPDSLVCKSNASFRMDGTAKS